MYYIQRDLTHRAVDSTETRTEEEFVRRDMMEGRKLFLVFFLFIACSNVPLYRKTWSGFCLGPERQGFFGGNDANTGIGIR